MDLLDLFDRASAWTQTKVAGATDQLDAKTPCDEWDVRAVMNHLVAVQGIFQGAARGEPGAPPAGSPPDVIGEDPVAAYDRARNETLDAFRADGALEKAGATLGIGFVDQLIHGWDIAKATGQDATMPADLAEAAFGMVDGRMNDDSQRGAFFKPAVKVPDDASSQDKLVAYGGRNPD